VCAAISPWRLRWSRQPLPTRCRFDWDADADVDDCVGLVQSVTRNHSAEARRGADAVVTALTRCNFQPGTALVVIVIVHGHGATYCILL
jgi:hypothetical protein